MARRFWTAAALVTMLATCGAHAQGRPEEQPTPLRFIPGRPCIDYRGKASIFTLQMETGQRIVATATGLAYHGADPAFRTLTLREVSVSLQTNYETVVRLNAVAEGAVPATGVYEISLSPESEAGNPGELLICEVQGR